MEIFMRGTFLAASLVVLMMGFSVAEEPKSDEAKKQATNKALETFSGTWDIISVQPEGVAKEATQLIFRKDWTYAALNKEGKELWSGTFELDPTATPKIWDHRSDESKKKGEDVLGIYELNGDTLKACVVIGTWKDKQWVGKPRPKELKLEGADVLIELKRAKPKK
jgi:uncharacterized protein (TIGR03067 family)